MSERTFLAKHCKSANGHKAANDRITILFCSNASGDYIMEPLVINKAKNPRSFKGININNLPVYWMTNKRAWVNASLFSDWFKNHFIQDIRKYLINKGLPFKVLLLLDNAPGHPQGLCYENIAVEFLPKNTTSLLQPLDQGIIATFKALYIKSTFSFILDQLENDDSISIINAWKKFTILDSVKHIGISYQYSNIIELAHAIGGEDFQDLNEEDIIKTMTDQELDEDELIEIVSKTRQKSESDVEAEIDECEKHLFTAKIVREGLALGKKLGNYFQQHDPNVERALQFQRKINEVLAQYEEELKDLRQKKSQLLITEFISKSHRTEIVSEESCVEILSSDDSEIKQFNKTRLIVESDSENSLYQTLKASCLLAMDVATKDFM
ncbi:tigger transposable element-derived protein 1-like [Condylostylus longicornis]|uniref:tigger transposable element-derived protein 1-like n=1 Tax=Condylostylus longicornis TaxID=2530218 RepID=UPI00244DA072|nr:tigger transposable element-derived protein 1-like [Condylostylus longicornis]